MNTNRYLATFKHSKGRWLVSETGGGYEGVRVHNARQLKYGNKPDPETGLFLGEQFGYFGHSDVKTLKLFTAVRLGCYTCAERAVKEAKP